MALEQEMTTYEHNLPSLLEHEGKFAVIKGDEILGVYETYSDALEFGYDKCGLEDFMVKQISAVEPILYFTRDIGGACPT